MPLTTSTVTFGTKIMLPTYIGVAAYIGCCYILSPPDRLQGPSLTVARALLPMPIWGCLALLIAAALLVAIATRHRQLAIAALCMGTGAYLSWSLFYGLSIFQDPEASLVSPVWPLVAAIAHVATAVSLSRDEVQ